MGCQFGFAARKNPWQIDANSNRGKAVTASAAFPAFLPAFDERLFFENNGKQARHRVMITDGGIYDNLGISCMLPGRSSEFSTNSFKIDFIIACDAGQGMPREVTKPYLWGRACSRQLIQFIEERILCRTIYFIV